MQTLGLGAAALIIQLIAWAITLLVGVYLIKRVVGRILAETNDASSVVDVLLSMKVRIISYLIWLCLLGYLTSSFTAYQPKVEIVQPRPVFEPKTDVVKAAPATPALTVQEKWDEKVRKNKAENQAAKDAFDKLPPAGQGAK